MGLNEQELNDLFVSFQKEMEFDVGGLYPKLSRSKSVEKMLREGKKIIVPAGKYIKENPNELVTKEWITLLSWIVKGGSGSENTPSPLDSIDRWTEWCSKFILSADN